MATAQVKKKNSHVGECLTSFSIIYLNVPYTISHTGSLLFWASLNRMNVPINDKAVLAVLTHLMPVVCFYTS